MKTYKLRYPFENFKRRLIRPIFTLEKGEDGLAGYYNQSGLLKLTVDEASEAFNYEFIRKKAVYNVKKVHGLLTTKIQ